MKKVKAVRFIGWQEGSSDFPDMVPFPQFQVYFDDETSTCFAPNKMDEMGIDIPWHQTFEEWKEHPKTGLQREIEDTEVQLKLESENLYLLGHL